MACLKLLLSGSLTLIVTTALFTSEDSVRLMKHIIPKHYDIKLVSYVNHNMFYGECNASINILQSTQKINLHVKNLWIIDMILINSLKEFDKIDQKIIVYKPKYFYNNETNIINLYFTDELSSGHYILNIKFTGTVADYKDFGTFRLKDHTN